MASAIVSASLTLVAVVVSYVLGRRDGRAALHREQCAEDEQIRREIGVWMMTPPSDGEMHFHDGPIKRYEATCPADAIALLLTSARRAQEEA